MTYAEDTTARKRELTFWVNTWAARRSDRYDRWLLEPAKAKARLPVDQYLQSADEIRNGQMARFLSEYPPRDREYLIFADVDSWSRPSFYLTNQRLVIFNKLQKAYEEILFSELDVVIEPEDTGERRPAEKVNCEECDARILQATYDKCGGLCMRCYQKEHGGATRTNEDLSPTSRPFYAGVSETQKGFATELAFKFKSDNVRVVRTLEPPKMILLRLVIERAHQQTDWEDLPDPAELRSVAAAMDPHLLPKISASGYSPDWIAFYAPVIAIGMPVLMPALLRIFFPEHVSAYSYGGLLLVSAAMLAPPIIALGFNLKFAFGRYVIAIAAIAYVFLKAITPQVLMSGSHYIIPLGGGLAGLALVFGLGYLGIAVRNAFWPKAGR
jgi:hypothetical protein